MRYIGGKYRIKEKLWPIIAAELDGCSGYLEPFCGAAWVALGVRHPNMILSDANKYLIGMYRALSAGWEPPQSVSEDEYGYYKAFPDASDPMTAFCGFGCSFGGKWFGGYARCKRGDNYAANTAGSLTRNYAANTASSFVDLFKRTQLSSGDYRQFSPRGYLIYCDPPYAGTTNGYWSKKFCSDTFWEWVRAQSVHNTVLVSEFDAPADFGVVAEFPTRTEIRNRAGERESLNLSGCTVGLGSRVLCLKIIPQYRLTNSKLRVYPT